MFLIIVMLSLAVGLDYLIGDPVYPYHPVRLIGHLIQRCETVIRSRVDNDLLGGRLLTLAVVGLVVIIYAVGIPLLRMVLLPLPFAANFFIVYSCIALGDLFAHAKPIAVDLNLDRLDEAREGVQRIVGRDVSVLDEEGVARATVESVSESFVDGFLAPIFWFVIGAIVGEMCGGHPAFFAVSALLAYRVVNTLDSMVGYKNDKYLEFGRFAARLDDALNFLPARLALPVLYIAAKITEDDAEKGWQIALRDRLKHASPNAAHAESFVAGALDLQLGGPTTYAHGTVDKPWLGSGRQDVTAVDIIRACRLITVAGWVTLVCVIILLVIV